MRIIAYTYEADYHCVACAQKRNHVTGFAVPLDDMARAGGLACDEHGLPLAATDRVGNPVHPVFSTDETEYRDEVTGTMCKNRCGDCKAVIQ